MTLRRSSRAVLPALLFALLVAGHLQAAEPFRYPEGRFEQAQLTYIEGLPVLQVEGTPAEIGRQEAMLTTKAAQRLMEYPKQLLAQAGGADRWPQLVKAGQLLVPQLLPDHLAEMEAYAAALGIQRDVFIGANTMVDTYRGGFGCSSLIVEADRSATKSPLFGRNLDFYTLGWLQEYSLVTVYRPAGKHAFVSIGFPGLLGSLSGMNDAGLALTTHEVFISADRAPLLNLKGSPYTFLMRRVLEECTTLDEAEKLLKSVPRTTLQNLAVCDRQHGCVFEITPKNVVRRNCEKGMLACTNHFRTKPLRTIEVCRRYAKLQKAQAKKTLGVADISGKLKEVGDKRMTLQTMVFEPGPLKLHLALGACPSSELPLKTLDLAELFAAPKEPAGAAASQ